jgi:uncharacterized protein (TIGR03083 family)
MALPDRSRDRLVTATARRTAQILEALSGLDDEALLSPSALPGWSRLTIACHLRYGAEALCRMTEAALSGEPAAYYPEGRDRQRPVTLVPRQGESNLAVVASLTQRSEQLTRSWSREEVKWGLEVVEPPGQDDLGTVDLGRLLMLRLTEVEVHGLDLGLDLPDWSTLFVREALPMRLAWLNTRRTNHRAFDANLEGSWLLVVTDGPDRSAYEVSVMGSKVTSRSASPDSPARAVIAASCRDLLALLLGRPFAESPQCSGDTVFGEAFAAAFPGP